MAGIKRRQVDDTEKTDTKKLKTDSNSKADKKFALKMARKDVKPSKSTKTEDKETSQSDDKKIKSKDKSTKEKKSRSSKDAPKKKSSKAPESDDFEEDSDPQEADDTFHGFEEDVAVKPAFEPLSDNDSDEEEEESEEQPTKKVKADDKANGDGEPKNGVVNGMILCSFKL